MAKMARTLRLLKDFFSFVTESSMKQPASPLLLIFFCLAFICLKANEPVSQKASVKSSNKSKYQVSRKKHPADSWNFGEPKKNLVVVAGSWTGGEKPLIPAGDKMTAPKSETTHLNESAPADIDYSKDAPKSNHYDKKTLAEVKKEIATTNRHYILYFGANWCVPCRIMRESVFNARNVKKYLQQFNMTYVDIDSFDGMDIKEMYDVTHIPYMVIFNAKGKQIGRIEGSIASSSFSEKLKTYLTQ